MLKMMVAIPLALALAVTALAQPTGSSEQLKRKQAAIQREIDGLRHTLNNNKKNTKTGLAQLELVKQKLRLREEAIDNISQQINIIEGTISHSKTEIDSLKTTLDNLKHQYAKSVVYTYQSRSNYDFLSFIFSSANFSEALRRMAYLRAYRQYHEQQAAAITNTQLLLHQKLTGLQVSRSEKDAVLQKQEKQRVDLESEKKEKNDVVNSLKAHEREITSELAAKQKAGIMLRKAIDKAIERELAAAEKAEEKEKLAAVVMKKARRAARSKSRKSKKVTIVKEKASPFETSPEARHLSNEFKDNKGHLPWPVESGAITVHYGKYKVDGLTDVTGFNHGLTLRTELQAPVKAVFEGDVSAVFAVENSWSVMVQHGKYFTVYGNLSAASVTRGQHITAGQLIGKVAANDAGNGGELEFLLMQEKQEQDPEKWVSKRR